MAELPDTRPSLLVRLRDRQDGDAWRQFVDLYAPLIYGLARKRGLQDADAADVTQEVFRAVSGAIQAFQYDRGRGSFRGWLYTIARNKLNDFRARQTSAFPGNGGADVQTLLEEQPARDEEETVWQRDYEQRLFAWAADQVRGEFHESTWQAFWQVAVEGKSGEEAARALHLSIGAVHVAKSRVLARLKKQIRQVED
jgi:RNA polymerase sigma-70 factor (ECF subfamily)